MLQVRQVLGLHHGDTPGNGVRRPSRGTEAQFVKPSTRRFSLFRPWLFSADQTAAKASNIVVFLDMPV
jgi:hypothetical protein